MERLSSVDFGEASVLITGDLEDAAIPGLVKRYEGTGLLDVDLYVVGHHGSINGTTNEFVEAMSPDCAVMSMGSAERELEWTAWKYGHPRKETVEKLEAGIAFPREPIHVRVGLGATHFEDHTVIKAIFATGWDGDVVLESGTDGRFRVAPASQTAAH